MEKPDSAIILYHCIILANWLNYPLIFDGNLKFILLMYTHFGAIKTKYNFWHF